jgi:hypothetical protein
MRVVDNELVIKPNQLYIFNFEKQNKAVYHGRYNKTAR